LNNVYFVFQILKRKIRTRKKKEKEEKMDAQFSENVYKFTEEIVKTMVEKFEGKVIGGEDANLEKIMKMFFDEYQPGDNVKVSSGPEKVKKKKKKTGPKKPTTAFFYYVSDIREQVKSENPELKTAELAKIHGKMWRELSEQDKEPYNQKNKEDKERYEKEKSELEV